MENENYIEKFVTKFIEKKSRICVFAASIITIISAFWYIAGVNLNAVPLVYTMFILATSILNLIYSLDVENKGKYTNLIAVIGMFFCIAGMILRIIQLGIGYSWEQFAAYIIFCTAIIMTILKITKNVGKKNIIIVVLAVLAAYSMFEFFYYRLPLIGFVWKLYNVFETTTFIGYIGLVLMNDESSEDFSKNITGIVRQIPSFKICIVLLAFVSVISGGIGAVRMINNRSLERADNADYEESLSYDKDDKSDTKKSDNDNEENTAVIKSPAPIQTSTPTPTEMVTAAPTEAPIPAISLGQTVSNNNFEFTLNRVGFSYDVMPDNPPSWYSHYQADSGQVYVYINASVKNLQQQGLECDEIYSAKAFYDTGYTYSGFNIVTDTDGGFTYANITSIDPLQTLGVHYLIDCPQEVESSGKPLWIIITLKDGSEYKYTIR